MRLFIVGLMLVGLIGCSKPADTTKKKDKKEKVEKKVEDKAKEAGDKAKEAADKAKK